MIKEIFISRTFWAALFMWALFIPMALVLHTTYLFDVVNSLVASIGVGVIIAYFPGIIKTLRGDKLLSGAQILVLGIAATWTATVGRHLTNWAWRYFDKPDWIIDHPAVAFWGYMIFTGGVLHLMARDSINGEIPSEAWRMVGIWISIALIMASVFIVYLEPSKQHP